MWTWETVRGGGGLAVAPGSLSARQSHHINVSFVCRGVRCTETQQTKVSVTTNVSCQRMTHGCKRMGHWTSCSHRVKQSVHEALVEQGLTGCCIIGLKPPRSNVLPLWHHYFSRCHFYPTHFTITRVKTPNQFTNNSTIYKRKSLVLPQPQHTNTNTNKLRRVFSCGFKNISSQAQNRCLGAESNPGAAEHLCRGVLVWSRRLGGPSWKHSGNRINNNHHGALILHQPVSVLRSIPSPHSTPKLHRPGEPMKPHTADPARLVSLVVKDADHREAGVSLWSMLKQAGASWRVLLNFL